MRGNAWFSSVWRGGWGGVGDGGRVFWRYFEGFSGHEVTFVNQPEIFNTVNRTF